MMPQDVRHSYGRVWRMPILLAALIVCGLLAALLGTGVWHLFSWTTLALPLVVIVRFAGFPRPYKADRDHSPATTMADSRVRPAQRRQRG